MTLAFLILPILMFVLYEYHMRDLKRANRRLGSENEDLRHQLNDFVRTSPARRPPP